MIAQGNTVERSHWLNRMPGMSKVQDKFVRHRSRSRSRSRTQSTAPPRKKPRVEPCPAPARMLPDLALSCAPALELLSPPTQEGDALQEINDFLYSSGPQTIVPEIQVRELNPRRVLLYEDGETDYILPPKAKKRFGESSTRTCSVSSSSHQIPTQDELQEPRSPREHDDEIIEMFLSSNERLSL